MESTTHDPRVLDCATEATCGGVCLHDSEGTPYIPLQINKPVGYLLCQSKQHEHSWVVGHAKNNILHELSKPITIIIFRSRSSKATSSSLILHGL